MGSIKEKIKIEVAPEIESLCAYPPGKPIEELERELGISGSIKLASNENPLGPSPLALRAAKEAADGVNRYPDGSCFYLKRRLADLLGVEEDMLVIGNGSNEIIELLARTFLTEGDEVLIADPSFAVYPIITQATRHRSVKVPLKDLTVDLEAMASALTARTKLVFIANPNNPTGTIVTASELGAFVDALPQGTILCMDEAYCEYVRSKEYPNSLELLRKSGKAIVVLRTFSKIYGLAGLRVGYGISDPLIVDYLERVRQPFNVNSLAQAAALAAIDDSAHVEASKKCNAEGLDYLFKELESMGVDCVPTEANFFLIKVGQGAEVYDALLKRGVIVRPMGGYGLDEFIRINVGTKQENERFIETFREVTGRGG